MQVKHLLNVNSLDIIWDLFWDSFIAVSYKLQEVTP